MLQQPPIAEPDDTSAMMRHDTLMTVTLAAEATGISRVIIRSWIKRGLLPATRSGRYHLVRREDLAAAQDRAYFGMVIPEWRANPHRAGERLRTVREACGWNQGQLATASGLTHEAISRLERGHHAPHAETVRALAEALGVAPDLFVNRQSIGLSLLTATEAANQLGVPTPRLLKWLRQGELPATKVSRHWRVPAIAVHDFARSGRLRGHSRRLDPRYRG